ncbi:hypothetical protein P153DRAFT_353763 [Dothidotthia symphoricarpi CBS 119687]|uniref:Adipose-regulatory protein-domain-containing protein n=1 Tax=Dothidotthia symphoricarpi CBS 119687 TaxID=1392245 RepID=A0A6A6AS94_9PLEO|nr:uncharacterized protein P153DRAFT_353763 [Dothidotthia symphoricarpi CBS 119687]KAF2133401.1 hypothetical protein P153DRAFT_353763 [Dothidotthia symphoricarpi CBS 119687]
MDEAGDEHSEHKPIVQQATETLLYPVRVATSPPLLRTYLRTALLLLTSAILFGSAVVAYTSFYYSYIPVRGITVPVHLHFDHGAPACFASPQTEGARAGKWPYGIADVDGLVSRQKYDVVVEMEVPRSDANIKAGNWMVGLEMRGPTTSNGHAKGAIDWDEDWDVEDHAGADIPADTPAGKPPVLAKSTRAALLTYRSRPTELANQLLRLPFYLLGWRTEAERIRVPMMDGLEFSKAPHSTPSSLRIELRSRYPIDIYRVRVRFVAKLEGLRWLMYHYRLTSLVIFTTLFWSVEMGVVLLTWAAFTLLFSSTPPTQVYQDIKAEHTHGNVTPKREQSPVSDASRTFPTLPSQQPLHYSSPSEAKVKNEMQMQSLSDIPLREDAEADDEEDDDFVLEEPVVRREAAFEDSGIGTSFESGVERERERGLRGRQGGRVKVKEESD